MTPFMRRGRLIFWVSVGIIAAVIEITVVTMVARSNVTRRSEFIVGVPERGAALFYGEKQCSICHSVNGSGGRLAPDLTEARPETPAMGWLTAELWNHGPGMWRQIRSEKRPIPELDPQEMADILSYLYRASEIDPPGDANTGRDVFRQKGCIRCHSVGATGGKTAPELSNIADVGDPSEWARAMLDHVGTMIGPIAKTLGQWPQFNGHEMNDLIAYVRVASPQSKKTRQDSAGDADRGWGVFQSRCIQCHAVRGQGWPSGSGVGPRTRSSPYLR